MKKALPIIVLLVLAIAASAGYYYYSRTLVSQERTFSASGTIEATEIDISSMVASQILSISVSEGSAVKAGQLIVRLDERILKDQVNQAKSNVEAAEANLEAAKDKGDSAEIDLAEAQLNGARAALAAAKVQMGFAKISSPTQGTILNVASQAGENASPGATILTIGRLNVVKLVLFVPENKLGNIKLGQQVNVTVDSYPNQIFKGKISKISSEAEFTPTNIQTQDQRVNLVFGVTVELPNPNLKLKPGMPADATLELISN